jgi:2-methylcitrate dehydratase PrpD
MTSTDRLADFVLDLTWEGLPDPVKDRARTCLLDAIGATIAGSDSRSGRIVSNFVMETWGKGDATVVKRGRTTPAGAALANGYMANALDIDDGGKYTRGHPGAQIIPAVLALAETDNSTGKEVLTAVVAGYETAHRVGRCWHERFEDYRSCGSWGSVACAAATAKLSGLTRDELVNALGISDYNSPYLPMMRAIEEPSMVKHGTGWGAMTGIMSAQLASRGFTGSGTSFESEDCNPWFDDLGDHFVMAEDDGVEFKEIPSCSWSHPPIKAALRLLESKGVSSDEIDRVEVRGFSEMVALCQDVPSSEEEAQFNVRWPLAVALLDGRVTVDGMSRNRFDDQETRKMVEKIEVVESDELDRLNKSLSGEVGETSAWPARVIIETIDDRSLDSGVVTSSPAEMASMEKIVEKFGRIVNPLLPEEDKRELIGMVKEFESLTRVRDLTDYLVES